MAESRIFKRGFQLDKTLAQFELKTKIKVISLHTPLSAVFYIYYLIIYTVVGASQSDCSIRESESGYPIRVYEF